MTAAGPTAAPAPGPAPVPALGSASAPAPVLRIGNASGFYGDRFDAVREMLTGGPLDVLTGDYLAELTMLILGRSRLKDPEKGYATTFLRQLEEGLGLAHERGVRIVANAGGLNPAGLADAVRKLAAKVGVPVAVAHVEGDSLPVPDGFLTANAYLGGAGSRPVCGPGPTSSSPAGSPTRPSSPARPQPTSAGDPTTWTPSPGPWSPGTSWSAARRRPAVTTPSSAGTTCAAPASRSPRSMPTGPP